MIAAPDFPAIAALVADATRGRILAVLMHGRARTATELALDGDVAPSTASSHLARLTDAGLLVVVKQGRHRYFRIASAEVAAVIEGLMGLAARSGLRTARGGSREDGLRRARVCYDHLAGEAGVRLLERLRERDLVCGTDDSLALTVSGEAWCTRVGIDLAVLGAKRRPLCRACLDWSERRTHLAGSLGAALLERLFVLRHARRIAGSRVVVLSPRGEAFVERPDLAV
jgi:DNA-binding transcriptional ArsR family regulator